MHDFTLGAPVDLGEYEGPLLNGKPLHSGSCEDGVYGCRKCNSAARSLDDEELEAIGWPLTQDCDWCHKPVPVRDIFGVRPDDEGGSCYYEVCRECYERNRRAEELEWKWQSCRLRRSCKRDCEDCDEDNY